MNGMPKSKSQGIVMKYIGNKMYHLYHLIIWIADIGCHIRYLYHRLALLRTYFTKYFLPKWSNGDITHWHALTCDIIAWWRHQMETFSALLALCAGNSPVPVNSPHKGQWRGALMISLICVRINDWVNNREAGDLRRHRGHYDVSVMESGC